MKVKVKPDTLHRALFMFRGLLIVTSLLYQTIQLFKKKRLPRRGIEPWSHVWQSAHFTTRPSGHTHRQVAIRNLYLFNRYAYELLLLTPSSHPLCPAEPPPPFIWFYFEVCIWKQCMLSVGWCNARSTQWTGWLLRFYGFEWYPGRILCVLAFCSAVLFYHRPLANTVWSIRLDCREPALISMTTPIWGMLFTYLKTEALKVAAI